MKLLKNLIAVVVLAVSWLPAFAQMSPAQIATFRAAMLAETDPVFVSLLANTQTPLIRDWYNTVRTPHFVVWKTRVSNDDIGDAMNGTEIAGLSSLNMQRAQMLANYSSGYQNPSRADRRAAFDQIFSGAGGTITRPALAALWKRNATRIEYIFANSTASPGTLVFEGPVSESDVTAAMQEQ